MEYSAVSVGHGRAIGQVLGAATGVAPPPIPTVTSALGRMDHLNERLSHISQMLGEVASTIGGPFPVGGSVKEQAMPSGVVHRLNESADAAHRQVDEIEDLIKAISRALG